MNEIEVDRRKREMKATRKISLVVIVFVACGMVKKIRPVFGTFLNFYLQILASQYCKHR
jgi:hypothetical protein